MKHSLKATSIIESMVVLLVVVTGIVGVFSLMTSSQRLANATSMRIEAIQIARDGLESFKNIRDTNWVLYGADYENCWNVVNYDPTCIGDDVDITKRIRGLRSSPAVSDIRLHKIFRDNTDNRFRLNFFDIDNTQAIFSNATYRTEFAVSKDNGFYTQSGGTLTSPLYTRHIEIDIEDTDGNGTPNVLFDDKIIVTSIVQWNDPAVQNTQRLEMSTVLTNWKAKK